jgi:hypothetical protein
LVLHAERYWTPPESEDDMTDRWSGKVLWIILGAVITVSALLGVGMLSAGHNWGDDFASYIMQAQSLVEGRIPEFVDANTFTIMQSSRNLGPVAYPWGTPLLLALPILLFGINLLALKTVNVACYLLFLAALAVGFRKRLSSPSLVALTAWMGVNPAILVLFNSILSDIPFLLFSTVTVFLIQHFLVERRTFFAGWTGYVLLGVSLAASLFFRTAGILLVFVAVLSDGIASFSASRRDGGPRFSGKPVRWRTLVLHALPYIVFLGLTGIANGLLPSGVGGYLQSLGEVSLQQVKTNTLYYVDRWQIFFSAIPFYPLMFGATLPFFFMGLLKAFRRYYPFALYMAGMTGLILLWPAAQGVRLLLPLFPFYLFFALLGLELFLQSLVGWEGALARLAVALCLSLSVVFLLRQSARLALANLRSAGTVSEGPYASSAQDLFAFIRGNSAEDAVIVFFKPRAMRLLTGRPSVQEDKPADIFLGDFLCIYRNEDEGLQISEADIEELLREGHLVLVYQNGEFRLYQILQEASGGV